MWLYAVLPVQFIVCRFTIPLVHLIMWLYAVLPVQFIVCRFTIPLVHFIMWLYAVLPAQFIVCRFTIPLVHFIMWLYAVLPVQFIVCRFTIPLVHFIMWLYAVLPVQFVVRPCLAYKRGLAKSAAALLAALPCHPSSPPAAARTKAGNSVGTEPVGRQGHTNHTGCFICVSSSPETGMSCIACQLATHCLHWQRF